MVANIDGRSPREHFCHPLHRQFNLLGLCAPLLLLQTRHHCGSKHLATALPTLVSLSLPRSVAAHHKGDVFSRCHRCSSKCVAGYPSIVAPGHASKGVGLVVAVINLARALIVIHHRLSPPSHQLAVNVTHRHCQFLHTFIPPPLGCRRC